LRSLHASPELVAGGSRRQHPELGTTEHNRLLLPGVGNRLSGGRYPVQQFSCFCITQVIAEVPSDRNVVLPADAADPGHDAIPVSPFLTEALIRNDRESLDPDRVRTAPQQDVTRSALAAGTVLERSRETCADSQGCYLKLECRVPPPVVSQIALHLPLHARGSGSAIEQLQPQGEIKETSERSYVCPAEVYLLGNMPGPVPCITPGELATLTG
jgi:hypothetical protein